MNDNATVPMRRTRVSREFLAAPVPMTPLRIRAHTQDTARVHTPVIDEPPRQKRPEACTTGRREDGYAVQLRRKYNASQAWGAALVVLATLVGLGFGVLVVALVAGGWR